MKKSFTAQHFAFHFREQLLRVLHLMLQLRILHYNGCNAARVVSLQFLIAPRDFASGVAKCKKRSRSLSRITNLHFGASSWKIKQF
jgi:hypothetical protein